MDARRLTLIWLMLLLSLPMLSESATYWVSTAGSAGSGCVDSPTPLTTTAKRNIADGISCLAAGDTLNIRGGTYNEFVVMANGPSGTNLTSGVVTIQATPGEAVTWMATAGALNIENAHHVIVRGITFDGTNGTNNLTSQYTALTVTGAEMLISFRCTSFDPNTGCAHHIRFENNVFRNTAYGSTQATRGTDAIEMRGNAFANVGKVEGANINYWQTTNALWDGNTFEGMPGTAIALWMDTSIPHDADHPRLDNPIIRNNTFKGLGRMWSTQNGTRICCHPSINNCQAGSTPTCSERMPQGYYVGGTPIFITRGSNAQVYNNVSLDSPGVVYASYSADNCLIANNSASGNTMPGSDPTGAGIYLGAQSEFGGSDNCTVQNNIIYQPGAAPPPIADAGNGNVLSNNMCSSGTNCTVNNPGFISPAGGTPQGLKLAAGSPAIGQGVNLSSTFTTDFEGTPRAAGTAPWDQGAFESSTPPQPDPLALELYFPLDEGSGTTAADASGNGHTGTLDTAVWSSPGIIGASSFGPLTGTQEITVSDLTGLSNTNSCSLNAWINMTTVDVGGCSIISNREGCSLYLGPTGLPQCWLFDGTNIPLAEGSTSVLTGTNHMLTCTYDRLDASPALRLSVDGVQTAVTAQSAPINYGMTGGAFRIGRDGANLGGYQCFGRIDEPRVYSGALTPTAIQNLYNQFIPEPGVAVVHTQWTAAQAPEGSFTGPMDSDRNLTFGTSATTGLRSALHNATGGSLTEYFRTFCRVNTGTWGAWTEVTHNFGSLGIRYLNPDTAVNLGDLTTRLLPLDGFAGTNGKFIADAVDVTGPAYDAAQKITFGHGQQAEHEGRLEFGAPLVTTNQVQCKLRRESGADLDDYGGAGDPLVKTLTLVPPAPPALQLVGGHVQGGRRQ